MELTKEEIQIWKDFQYYDKHGRFPTVKKKKKETISLN